jgi:hypothetical protein
VAWALPTLTLAMRLIIGIACLLLGLGMLSCRVGPAMPPGDAKTHAEGRALEWVRTVDGWERAGSWYVSEVRRPQLHPLVVAAGQGLVSLLGLAACSGRER